MTAIRFATKVGAPVSYDVEFTRPPSFPRACTEPAPARIVFATADGTVHVEEKGYLTIVDLTWPEAGPMSAGDYYLTIGNNLRDFYAAVRGGQDCFDFRDDAGDVYDAYFEDVPRFAEVAQGFAGTIRLRVVA
jgi:hypothetical protein